MNHLDAGFMKLGEPFDRIVSLRFDDLDPRFDENANVGFDIGGELAVLQALMS